MHVLNSEGQKCNRKRQKCVSQTEERYNRDKRTEEKVQLRISRTQIMITTAVMAALSV